MLTFNDLLSEDNINQAAQQQFAKLDIKDMGYKINKMEGTQLLEIENSVFNTLALETDELELLMVKLSAFDPEKKEHLQKQISSAAEPIITIEQNPSLISKLLHYLSNPTLTTDKKEQLEQLLKNEFKVPKEEIESVLAKLEHVKLGQYENENQLIDHFSNFTNVDETNDDVIQRFLNNLTQRRLTADQINQKIKQLIDKFKSFKTTRDTEGRLIGKLNNFRLEANKENEDKIKKLITKFKKLNLTLDQKDQLKKQLNNELNDLNLSKEEADQLAIALKPHLQQIINGLKEIIIDIKDPDFRQSTLTVLNYIENELKKGVSKIFSAVRALLFLSFGVMAAVTYISGSNALAAQWGNTVPALAGSMKAIFPSSSVVINGVLAGAFFDRLLRFFDSLLSARKYLAELMPAEYSRRLNVLIASALLLGTGASAVPLVVLTIVTKSQLWETVFSAIANWIMHVYAGKRLTFESDNPFFYRYPYELFGSIYHSIKGTKLEYMHRLKTDYLRRTLAQEMLENLMIAINLETTDAQKRRLKFDMHEVVTHLNNTAAAKEFSWGRWFWGITTSILTAVTLFGYLAIVYFTVLGFTEIESLAMAITILIDLLFFYLCTSCGFDVGEQLYGIFNGIREKGFSGYFNSLPDWFKANSKVNKIMLIALFGILVFAAIFSFPSSVDLILQAASKINLVEIVGIILAVITGLSTGPFNGTGIPDLLKIVGENSIIFGRKNNQPTKEATNETTSLLPKQASLNGDAPAKENNEDKLYNDTVNNIQKENIQKQLAQLPDDVQLRFILDCVENMKGVSPEQKDKIVFILSNEQVTSVQELSDFLERQEVPKYHKETSAYASERSEGYKLAIKALRQVSIFSKKNDAPKKQSETFLVEVNANISDSDLSSLSSSDTKETSNGGAYSPNSLLSTSYN